MPEPSEGELLTARLRLRLPAPDDAHVVRRIHQDPAAVAHNPSDALADHGAAEELLPSGGPAGNGTGSATGW